MTANDRMPPHSREAERCVLGSMLRDNATIGDVLQIVHKDNFYADPHQKIFQAIVTLYDRSQPVDLVVLAELLKTQKLIEDTGGYGYLAELWDVAPTAANAEYYARIVRDKAVLRHLIHAGTEILRDAYDQVMPADELLGTAEAKILNIAESGTVAETVAVGDLVTDMYDRLDERAQRKGQISGISTGHLDLDKFTDGLKDSELIILAARPSVGKTALALTIAHHVAIEHVLPTLFVSLEQSKQELEDRLGIMMAEIPSQVFRKGDLTAEQHRRLLEAGALLSKAPLLITDTPQQRMATIAANARRMKLRKGIRLVMVDYLQLIEPEDRRESRQEQVAGIARRLKHLARELRVAVLALAQINRGPENRTDRRPRLSDIRESGGIEADADVVVLLHEEEADSTTAADFASRSRPRVVEAIVAKHRNGPTGTASLIFQPEYMRFENYAPGPGPNPEPSPNHTATHRR